MSQITNQASFNSGEWSPNVFARVDLQKYKSAAALLQNWFVDYRGGASTRTGTEYIIQAYKSTSQVRLFTFQASFNAGYVLEFGDGYIRFIYRGNPVIENAFPITAITKANPCVMTITGHNYLAGDEFFVDAVVGMTQVNQRYFKVLSVAGDNVTVGDLNDVAINSTGYSTYVSGGTAARIYKITSPYVNADNFDLIKVTQSVNQMVICHPNHTPYILSIISAANWTLTPISIGATISPPATASLAITSSLGSGGSWNYAYVITSIDGSGQESAPSDFAGIASGNIRQTAGSIKITWGAVQGAVAYNVYEAVQSSLGPIALGAQFGFIGTTKTNSFVDSNISQDFSQSPPIAKNPFVGSGIEHITVTTPGTYTAVPTVTFSGSPTLPASAIAELQVQGTPAISSGGAGHSVGDRVQFLNGLIMLVTGVAAGAITSWSVYNPGSITSGVAPTNPIAQIASTGAGTGAAASATWGVANVIVIAPGAGFITPPTVIFSFGGAVATATLNASSTGFPTVAAFAQQRLILAGSPGAPATFYISRPGQYYNFDVSSPSKASDAISGTLVAGTLNSIKSAVAVSAGVLLFTDKAVWLINGGTAGAPLTPSAVANPQSYVGANDVRPLVINYDVLYIQSEGSAVRDVTYNIYINSYTGTDVSLLSSHLFYGYTIKDWCWSQQPFYQVQSIRNDGVLLSMTYLKEQEFIAWTHSVTQGLFKSVVSVTETVGNSSVDAVYVVVQRTINGQTVQYIERFAERTFTNGAVDAWCVDAGIQYNGAPITTFTGAEHLAGVTVTGLADGQVIAPFVMPVNGIFTLPTPASKVTIGLGFTCDLQTLPLDISEEQTQGKVKKISSVNVRVKDALNLYIGSSFNTLVPMKDLRRGNVSSGLTGQPNQMITDLVTGDAITFLDPTYTVPGQYCIRQSDPLPATVLGVFPRFVIGDTK